MIHIPDKIPQNVENKLRNRPFKRNVKLAMQNSINSADKRIFLYYAI